MDGNSPLEVVGNNTIAKRMDESINGRLTETRPVQSQHRSFSDAFNSFIPLPQKRGGVIIGK